MSYEKLKQQVELTTADSAHIQRRALERLEYLQTLIPPGALNSLTHPQLEEVAKALCSSEMLRKCLGEYSSEMFEVLTFIGLSHQLNGQKDSEKAKTLENRPSIKVLKAVGGYIAFIVGKPQRRADGPSADMAVGKLMRERADELGIKITYKGHANTRPE